MPLFYRLEFRQGEPGSILPDPIFDTPRANLYRWPLDGGEPERLTDFNEQRMYWFELAPDGETLVISRGELSRDAVLLENFLR